MEPKELAYNFIKDFTNYTDDEKSICLSELAKQLSTNFDESIVVYIEDDEFADSFSLNLKKSTILFCWNDSI